MTRTPIKQQKSRPFSSSADDLLAAAERLIGEDGVHVVSLRQIAMTAGHTNNSAVQYHFGDKDGLIRAIFEKHLPYVENSRRRFLENVYDRGVTVPLLVEAMYRPITEEVDADGRRTYARFVAKIIGDRRSEHHWAHASGLVPSAHEVFEKLASLCSHLDADQLLERMWLINGLVFQAIYRADTVNCSELTLQRKFSDAISMASGALLAPA